MSLRFHEIAETCHRIHGTGVDINAVFLESAKNRAHELNVADNLTFIQDDAGKYSPLARDLLRLRGNPLRKKSFLELISLLAGDLLTSVS